MDDPHWRNQAALDSSGHGRPPPVTAGDGERNLVAAWQRPGAPARCAPCRPERAIALAEAAEASLPWARVESGRDFCNAPCRDWELLRAGACLIQAAR
jgi:hypothetical protein